MSAPTAPHSVLRYSFHVCFFLFIDPPTATIYTLSLHDALPIYRGDCQSRGSRERGAGSGADRVRGCDGRVRLLRSRDRSEEHTSELQSHHDLVFRLLLEKKKACKGPTTAGRTGIGVEASDMGRL